MKTTFYIPVIVEISDELPVAEQKKVMKQMMRDLTTRYGGNMFAGSYSYRTPDFTQKFLKKTANHKF